EVVTCSVLPVSRFCTVTLAPGTTAPLGSVTMPCICARYWAWACIVAQQKMKSRRIRSAAQECDIASLREQRIFHTILSAAEFSKDSKPIIWSNRVEKTKAFDDRCCRAAASSLAPLVL